MRFSDCGSFLHGVKIGSENAGQPVFLHLAPFLSHIPLSIADTPEMETPSCALTASDSGASVSIAGYNNQPIESRGVELSGIPKFTTSQGQLQISALSQDHDRGLVMLQTMRADGKMIEETITRLPKSSTLEKSYSTLVSTDGNACFEYGFPGSIFFYHFPRFSTSSGLGKTERIDTDNGVYTSATARRKLYYPREKNYGRD
jgi:hypothetical protein